MRGDYRSRLQQVWQLPDANKAEAALIDIHAELKHINRSAANALLEGLQETLTIQRTGQLLKADRGVARHARIACGGPYVGGSRQRGVSVHGAHGARATGTGSRPAPRSPCGVASGSSYRSLNPAHITTQDMPQSFTAESLRELAEQDPASMAVSRYRIGVTLNGPVHYGKRG